MTDALIMFRGSTILHGPEHEDYALSDSRRGIRRAHQHGATAIDLNIRTCLSDDGKSRVIVVIHWEDWWKHGWHTKKGHSPVPHKPIEKLRLHQVRSLVHHSGVTVLTATQAIRICQRNHVVPFFELKPSVWSFEALAALRAYAAQRGTPVAVMTIQAYGKNRFSKARWERAAKKRMTTAYNAGFSGGTAATMLLARGRPLGDWGNCLVAIKGHKAFTAPNGHRVVSLGGTTRGATEYGCSVGLGNARSGTKKVHRLMTAADNRRSAA